MFKVAPGVPFRLAMPPSRRWLTLFLIVAALAVAAACIFLAIKWPFTRSKVTASLADEFGSEVRIRSFRETFWPRPGCVAEGVMIYRGEDLKAPPLLTVDKLTVAGNYPRLLTFSKTLSEVRADGLRILIPQKKYPRRENRSSSATAAIERFVATRSTLAFESEKPGAEPFTIQIHEVTLSPASATSAMAFQTSLAIPEPPGEVQASGRFGPWQHSDPYKTPVSGSYVFRDANLGKFEGLSGTLSSSGRFNGEIDRIAVAGHVDTPNFEITSTAHALPVTSDFRATVNGRTGDVMLDSVDARVLGTEIVARGSVAAERQGAGKTLSVDLRVNGGRIQDLMRLVNSGPPKLAGATNLRFKVRLPPGGGRFLEKLQITGQMGVGDARFTTGDTQQKLEHVSQNADGGKDDPAEVLSALSGRISVANGVASLSGVRFQIPGASADLTGPYGLLSKSVDLRGTVYLKEKVSEATTGIKSFLLKALDPFFKKRKRLSVVPVRISGRYGDTSIGFDR